MKKTVKKLVALIVTLAVLAVPMLVSAAVYDENTTTELSLGTKNYSVNTAYDYAIFELQPNAAAEYTITVSGGLVGKAVSIGTWVDESLLSSSNISSDSVSWKCTSVGQSMLFGVKADKSSYSISVTKKPLVVEQEIPWVEYVNLVEPTPFTFEGNEDDLMYVETFEEGDFVDYPVLGEDGFYHLNDENGPILYVDLDDDLMNLIDAHSFGQLVCVGYSGGKISSKTNYNNAFEEYMNNADKKTRLYPLTEDLITIYRRVGEHHMWYGEEGFVGGTEEDAWMFACYYLPIDDDNDQGGSGDGGNDGDLDEGGSGDGGLDEDDNTGNDNTGSGDAENNNTGSGDAENNTESDASSDSDNYGKSPLTGDSAAGLFAMLLAALSVFVFALKKRCF